MAKAYSLYTILILFTLFFANSCGVKNEPDYVLTTQAVPEESGTVTQSASEIRDGKAILITATANEHWIFVGWAGDLSGTNQPSVYVSMDRNRDIQALFEKIVYESELNTTAVASVTKNSAVTGGTISSDGGAAVTERGVCYSITQNPDKSGTCTSDGQGTGSFTSTLTSLSAETVYYVRAYSVNSVGISYGNQRSFTTDPEPQIVKPTVKTFSISSITTNSASIAGNVASDGGAKVTERGVCVSTSQKPTRNDNCKIMGSGIGSFRKVMTGLKASKTYYVRAFATNSQGIRYGEQRSFTTKAVSTPPPSSPPPSAGSTQVALIFLDGVNLDVTVNGTLYSANTSFHYTFNNNGVRAGVKVVTVSGNLTTMQLNPGQIRRQGLNADGFGVFSYKVVNKNPGTNMYGIHAHHNSSQEFWGNAATSNPLGIIVSRLGDVVYGTKYPDPLFYLGWRHDPVNQPNNRNFTHHWSNTRKMAFSFFNLGKSAN